MESSSALASAAPAKVKVVDPVKNGAVKAPSSAEESKAKSSSADKKPTSSSSSTSTIAATTKNNTDEKPSAVKKSASTTDGNNSNSNNISSSGNSNNSTSSSSQRAKAYTSNLRSAAAAHRKDKIAIPPIGSPGLLLMPNPALTANFPKDISTPEELKKWLYRGQYLLPATVFRRAMEVGGYTKEQRANDPHRGSTTERQVGDMFDSDVGGLYLHFPDLIPRRIWERRLGGNVDDYDNDECYLDDFPVRDRRKRSRKKRGSRSSSGSSRQVKSGSKSSDGASNTNGSSGGGSNNNGGSKSKDHPTGVKGARSSYIFFTHEMRPKMMKEFPGMKFTEQGVIMGERWRALTPEQKKPYEDLANEDKKRYAKEWAAYLETVKQEIREEKELGGKKKDEGEEEEDDEDDEEDDDEPVVKATIVRKKSKEAAINGPRLVDAVILSMCNLVGEKAYRTEPLPPMPKKNQVPLAAAGNDSAAQKGVVVDVATTNADTTRTTTDAMKSDAKSVEVAPEQARSDPNIVKSAANPEQVKSSDANAILTNDTNEETKPQPPKDLTLEELPKLNPARPQIRKRCRPHEPMSFLDMIPTSLTCTYPQEYVTKRRAYAEAVRAREEAIIASQEAKDDSDDAREKYVAHTEAWERMLEYQKQQIAKKKAERLRQKEKKEVESSKNGQDGGDAETTGNDSSKEEDEKDDDPMDCMPPRPKSPPPARVVSIPDIPTPPTPPQLLEMDENDMDTENDNTSIIVPKKKTELLQHLDPDCFIPNMNGRYFGLLSNGVADPQFVGPSSTGIRGTTFGGGTGLATSYVGGGRGASGLVSGPSRSSVGSRASLMVLAMEEDTKTSTSSSDGTTVKKKKRSASTSPSSSSSSSKKKKKDVKKLCLATGDRVTSATEVSSGSAGPEFPDGWIVKTYRRSGGETIGKTDRFWFSPGRNIRFRAKKHAKKFIEILNEPEIDGSEDAAAEAYKKRGLNF